MLLPIKNLDSKNKAALLAAVAWSLYKNCHLIEAIEDLELTLLMARLLYQQHQDSLYGSAYGERENLANLAAAIANSMVDRE